MAYLFSTVFLRNLRELTLSKVVSGRRDVLSFTVLKYPAGVRRQALTPFTFSDGLHVSPGDWVCVPHRSMMRDSRYFDRPLDFDGSRFFKEASPGLTTGAQQSKLTDVTDKWLVWGAGRISWCVYRLLGDSIRDANRFNPIV